MVRGTAPTLTLEQLLASKRAGGGTGALAGWEAGPSGAAQPIGGYLGEPEQMMQPMQELQPQAFPASILAGAGALGTALPGVSAAIGALGIPAGALATIGGIAAAGVGLAQALGFGEGGGLFGLNILGGDEEYRSGIPFGGPGLAEPPAEWIEKEWHVTYDWGRLQYYLVRMPSGLKKIALYNTRTKKWKVWTWRTPRLAVIGKNMPSHKMITRLRRNLKKHSADARTILKMTSPHSLAQPKRRRR